MSFVMVFPRPIADAPSAEAPAEIKGSRRVPVVYADESGNTLSALVAASYAVALPRTVADADALRAAEGVTSVVEGARGSTKPLELIASR